MFAKFIYAFLISMVPIIELRGAVVYAYAVGLPVLPSLLVCTLGNMIPVPFIYFFARKWLLWGTQRRWIGRFCGFILRKGESAGRKLAEKAGRGGMFVALLLFIGIPVPGTGAWMGTLGASLLNMGFKSTVVSACLGVVMSATIMMTLTALGFNMFT